MFDSSVHTKPFRPRDVPPRSQFHHDAFPKKSLTPFRKTGHRGRCWFILFCLLVFWIDVLQIRRSIAYKNETFKSKHSLKYNEMSMQQHRNLERILIFLASTSDTSEEKKLFHQIIEDVNKLIAKPMGMLLEAVVWEDTLIGKGRPQEKINDDLKQCNLVVMLLWERWGSSTGDYPSGFEEEYEVADANEKDIWLYFREVPEEDMVRDPVEQLKNVIKFKKKITYEKKYLYWTYKDKDDWGDKFREHLSQWLHQRRSESSPTESEIGNKLKSSQNIQEMKKPSLFRNETIEQEKIAEKEIQLDDINEFNILIGNNESPYLKIGTRDRLCCTLFGDPYGFSDGTYYFHAPQEFNVSLEKLEKILKTFYITFRAGHEFDSHPTFIINQTCSENEVNYSWFGFGLKNFIQSLKEQSKRYTEAGIVRPHHGEAASFVASGPNFIFYAAFQPDVIKENGEPNFDYMQVGFIFEEMPFNNRKFIEFYKNVGLEEPDFVHYGKEEFNVRVVDLRNRNFNLERKAFVVYNNHGQDWVSKVIFENPFYGNKTFNEYLSKPTKIVVNLIDYHPLESNENYFLRELRIIPIPYGNFGFVLLKIIGNW